MRATGFIRRVDDLGRVFIPKEVRDSLNIREGDPFEIFIDPNERTVCFKLVRKIQKSIKEKEE